jgi:hypothetical protein
MQAKGHAMSTEKFISKLSNTKAGPRTRLWLEGARVANAGFKVGLLVRRDWKESGSLVLTIIDAAAHDELPRSEKGRVSGKGEKPILDITGAAVAAFFTGDKVAVTYKPGKITISSIAP